MTQYERLLQRAQDSDITVIPYPIAGQIAVSFRFRGESMIALDFNRLKTDAQRTEALAHELDHLERGTTQSKYTRFIPREKLEHQTDAHVIEALIPRHQLDDCLAFYDGRLWEVAEDFGLPESLVKKAIKYYQSKEGV